MLKASKLIPRGAGLAPALVKRAARLELDWDLRQKSRFEGIDTLGRALGVFLPRGTVVRGGDVLVAEDGTLVIVTASPQPVMVVTACPRHGSQFDLLRAAYHLGNRHVALQLAADHLKLEPDHVLAAMLRQMHLIVSEAIEAFEPEGGAYAAGSHGDAHAHAHAHAQDHDHEHAQAAAPASAPPHVHGPECGHGHGDGQGHGHDHRDGRGPEPGPAR